ncbi:MAG: type II secretion system minor pseudopilin GspK [Pseudomonadota bacterium]|nr:type II secretion system minor pseudopilin GspK [Pseudomonadota bacterium]
MATRTSERGVALIVVILMIGVIVAITLQLNRATRSEVYDAANLRDGIRLFYVAQSGFYLAQALLADDRNNFDALNEDWALASKVEAKASSLFGPGVLRVTIEDESGKVPINKLLAGNGYNRGIRDLMARLLTQPEFGLEERQASDLIDALKDWMDKDDEVTGGGAETSYYAGLAKPYAAKNGPLDCIEELMMIKGISPELYHGTGNRPGLKHLFTLYGDGRININTAPLPVLRALSPTMTAEAAEQIDAHRRKIGEDLSSLDWYRKAAAGVDIDAQLIAVQSRHFRIVSTGVAGNMTRSIQGVAMRSQDKKTMKILSWKAN